MAKTPGARGSRGRPGRPRRDAGGKGAAKPVKGANRSKPAKAAKAADARPPAESLEESPAIEGPFVLGAIPGATPGKWIDAWKARTPDVEIDLRPISAAGQRAAILEGELDAALVRLPIDKAGLHVIALYDEVPVVVAAVDSHLMAADDLGLDDLIGEIVIVAQDDVLGVEVAGGVAASFAAPEDTEQAIAIVASGVGVVIVPMSLARLHRRKDVDHRPLRDGPVSTVALAWPTEHTTPAVEAFVGIVRGRTANSSR